MDEWYHLSNKENSMGSGSPSEDMGCALCGQSFDSLDPMVHYRFVCTESDGLNLVQRLDKLEEYVGSLIERIAILETTLREFVR